jgi:hypothetical protein
MAGRATLPAWLGLGRCCCWTSTVCSTPYGTVSCPAGYTEHELFPGDEEPVRLCVRHGEWIAELTGPFEVVWASAWGSEANRLLGPLLDLPELAFVEFPPAPFPPAEKVPAISRHLGDRAAVWIDDMLTAEAHAWAAARRFPTLLLDVNPVSDSPGRSSISRSTGRHGRAADRLPPIRVPEDSATGVCSVAATTQKSLPSGSRIQA